MANFSTRARYLASLIFTMLIFIWTLNQHAPAIYQIVPTLTADHESSLSWSRLIQQPFGFIFFLSPLFLSLATGLLFLSVERDHIYEMFQSTNLVRLRIAGWFLILTLITSTYEPTLYGWLVHTNIDTPLLIDPALFLLCTFGGWLATLSNQGGKLLQHAKKLRSELDDIV